MQSGIYTYFLNSKPAGVSESFSIETQPDGSKATKAIRDAAPFKTLIEIETIESAGKFRTCKISFKKDDSFIEAAYSFSGDSFKLIRKFNGSIIQDESLPFPAGCLFFPLMRCFQGQIILNLANNQDITSVLVPDIQSNSNLSSLLKPTFDERSAKLISKTNNVRIFNYLSKHYDDNSEFHLDESGLLIYYKFIQSNDQVWEAKLNP